MKPYGRCKTVHPSQETDAEIYTELKKVPVVSLATVSGARRFVYQRLVYELEAIIENDVLTEQRLDAAEERRVRKAANGVLKHLRKRATTRKP